MVDNSQGHLAYSTDALVASRMNVNPGGKQARMHDTWFMQDGQRITQAMVYPADHPTSPNELKGIRAVLIERGLYPNQKTRGKCKKKCDTETVSCCLK